MCQGIDDNSARTQPHLPAAADYACHHLYALFKIEQSRLLPEELHEYSYNNVGVIVTGLGNRAQEPGQLWRYVM